MVGILAPGDEDLAAALGVHGLHVEDVGVGEDVDVEAEVGPRTELTRPRGRPVIRHREGGEPRTVHRELVVLPFEGVTGRVYVRVGVTLRIVGDADLDRAGRRAR